LSEGVRAYVQAYVQELALRVGLLPVSRFNIPPEGNLPGEVIEIAADPTIDLIAERQSLIERHGVDPLLVVPGHRPRDLRPLD
jgi:hypothetical protein